MAAFNLEEAARQGRGETLPSGWTRFSVSRGTLWSNFIIYTVGAVVVFGLAVYLFITGSLPGGTPGDQGFAPLEFVGLLIGGCIFLWIGLRIIPLLIKSQQYFFLITGEGFVYVADKKLVGLPFAEISGTYRQIGLLGGKLVIQRPAGGRLVLSIGRFYATRTVREMEETLVAALKSASQSKRGKRR